MAKTQGKKSLILITIVIGIALVVVIGGFLFAKSASTPTKVPTTITTDQPTTNTTTETDATDSQTTTSASTTPKVDPSTLKSIDIEPLGITVFYSKGTPGFAYDIQKTADQTQYVEFTSTDLVGTKCTNDQGIFATIIKNPTSTEDQTTLTATTKVGSDTYGLSLTSADCTSNTDLLSTYQAGFKNGFSSLKAIAQ